MSTRSLIIFSSFFGAMSYSPMIYADSGPKAILASVEGSVQILRPLVNEAEGEGAALFEGRRYKFSKAKIGNKIQSAEVVMTSTDGKAKVIYDLGDVVIVGPSSSLVIPATDSKLASNKEMNLMYGRVRAVVDKDGPLSGLKIKTPSAVAGVRGTDLYVQYNPASNGTEVQVMRGEVEVKPERHSEAVKSAPGDIQDHTSPTEAPKTILNVKAGEIAIVEIAKSPKTEGPAERQQPSNDILVKSEVKSSSQLDLGRVQKETTVQKSKDGISDPVKKDVAAHEQKAVENIMKDIQRYDQPGNEKVATAFKERKVDSVETANTMSLYELYKSAPKAPASVKPSSQELMDKGDDVYDQYFKPLNL